MNTAAPAPRVLVIGLDPYRIPGPWDPAPVAEAIAVGMARFTAAGVGVESCLIGLGGTEDVEAVVTRALDRRPWEVVVVGGGIRKAEDQLELFERIVNLVHRHAPGAAIAFNVLLAIAALSVGHVLSYALMYVLCLHRRTHGGR